MVLSQDITSPRTCFNISLNDDTFAEGTERFSVLSELIGSSLSSITIDPAEAVVFIEDNDVATTLPTTSFTTDPTTTDPTTTDPVFPTTTDASITTDLGPLTTTDPDPLTTTDAPGTTTDIPTTTGDFTPMKPAIANPKGQKKLHRLKVITRYNTVFVH